MSRRTSPKKLLVEGPEDKRVIPQLLIAQGIQWKPQQGRHIIDIKPAGGVEGLLKQGMIATELKASNLKVLGIIMDADDRKVASRWERIRQELGASFDDLPHTFPAEGWQGISHTGVKCGVWFMPDNFEGMLESYLSGLIQADQQALWDFAKSATEEAKAHHATYKEAHLDKAQLYTFLAWSDPPGRQIHDAVIKRILDPAHPSGRHFLAWFCELYELEMSASTE